MSLLINIQDEQPSGTTGSETESLALTEPPSVCLFLGSLKLIYFF